MKALKIHQAAQLLPLLARDEFEELKADIKKHGQLEPILMQDGVLIDGRNRLMACEELGVRPRITQYEGDDPVGRIISLNIHRRHLTKEQKAKLIVEIVKAGNGHRAKVARWVKGQSGSTKDPVKAKVLEEAKKAHISERTARQALVDAEPERKRVSAKKRKPRSKRVQTFEQQVEAKFVRLLESFPIAREDEVIQIILRILKKQPAGKTITL